MYYLLQQRKNQIKFKQNEPDKISSSLLSKLIMGLSKLLSLYKSVVFYYFL